MIVTIRFPPIIDEGLKEILPLDFIKQECRASDQAIKAVRANRVLYLLKRCPAAYLCETRSVVLDPSAPLDRIVENLKHRFVGISPSNAWKICLLHEIGHAREEWSEQDCDLYAKSRLRWREDENALCDHGF